MELDASTTDTSDEIFVVFRLDEQRYGVPLTQVQRSLRVVAITPLPQAPPIVLGIVDLAGVVVPVIDLRKRFRHPPRPLRLSDHLIVCTTSRRTVALLVDETKGVLTAPTERTAPAGAFLSDPKLVTGAVQLADGLVLIHDLERLLSLDEESAIDRALDTAHADTPPPEPLVR